MSRRRLSLPALALLAGLAAALAPGTPLAAGRGSGAAGNTECLDRAQAIGASRFNDGEPSVKADPVDPRRLVAAWTRSPQSTTSSPIQGRVVLAQRDVTGSWTQETIAWYGGDPWVDFAPGGTAYVSYLGVDPPRGHLFVRRVVPGQPAGEPIKVTTLEPNVDHPSTAVDQRPGVGAVIYVVSGYDRAHLTSSPDGGRHWRPAVPFPDAEPGFAQGAPVMATGGDRVVVAWQELDSVGRGGLIRAALYDPKSRSFSAAATLAKLDQALYLSPQDFGASSIPSLAVARRGPAAGTAYVTWTQYAHDGEDADVLVSASRDGAAWTAPRRVNDDPAGATQVYPSVSARPDGGALVAWLDSRDGGAGNDAGRMYVAPVSPDGVPGPNLRLTRCPSFPEVPGAYGDYFNFDASQGNLELIFPQIRTPGGYSDVFFLEQVPPGSGARGSAKEAQ